MPPSFPVPPGAAIPAAWELFEVLLLATFAAHLLVMNVALGGTLLAVLTPGPGREAARGLAKSLPTAVAVTVNLGVPPLLFASVLYGQYLYSAAILSAVTWLALFMLVMIAYALLYRFQPRADRPGASGLAVLAGLLLLGASLVMVNVSTLMAVPGVWSKAGVWPEGLVLNLADPTFLPRWLHFVLASLAVAGLFLALVKSRAAARGDGAAQAARRLGLAWFGRASLVQMLVGAWFLLALPRTVVRLFMGGDGLATAALLSGIVLAVLALLAAWREAPGESGRFPGRGHLRHGRRAGTRPPGLPGAAFPARIPGRGAPVRAVGDVRAEPCGCGRHHRLDRGRVSPGKGEGGRAWTFPSGITGRSGAGSGSS